jgi:hypothetical protein
MVHDGCRTAEMDGFRGCAVRITEIALPVVVRRRPGRSAMRPSKVAGRYWSRLSRVADRCLELIDGEGGEVGQGAFDVGPLAFGRVQVESVGREQRIEPGLP